MKIVSLFIFILISKNGFCQIDTSKFHEKKFQEREELTKGDINKESDDTNTSSHETIYLNESKTKRYERWYYNGKLNHENYYDDSLKMRVSRIYFMNTNQIGTIDTSLNNTRYGHRFSYSICPGQDSIELNSLKFFLDGITTYNIEKKEEIFQSFYGNGMKQTEVYFKNDVRKRRISYSRDGKIIEDISFKNCF